MIAAFIDPLEGRWSYQVQHNILFIKDMQSLQQTNNK